ncbi:hypothetical protein RU639_012651 [Aspergillus parasiticus]
MPTATLHLLALKVDVPTFLQDLQSTRKVIVASRPRHIVIHPVLIDKDALPTPWDLLVLIQSEESNTFPIPEFLQFQVKSEYRILVGIPSKLLATYPSRSQSLKRAALSIPLTGSINHIQGRTSSQSLEVTPELLSFMNKLSAEHPGPVTMLNLLHFNSPGGKDVYYKYGQAFGPVAGRRGGNAKLVATVIRPDVEGETSVKRKGEEGWDEISIVHYPSIRHFCDMLAGEDYQRINEKFRLGSLKDTFLLCTTEFDVEETALPARGFSRI